MSASAGLISNPDFYRGAQVSQQFMQRWMSQLHTGQSKPWQQVRIRRGKLVRSWHTNWPDPQFGRLYGDTIRHQWYADWTPFSDWQVLDSVHSVQTSQSFDQNGISTLTVSCDNVRFVEHTAGNGQVYHLKERGFLYPWRGYIPPNAPGGGGSGDLRNEWYRQLPNAQIEVWQGYGEDTGVKVFTGLIDNVTFTGTPDVCTITARDFGGVLTDSNVFGWNKTRTAMDPIMFVPMGYTGHQIAHSPVKRWIYVNDVTEIVECVLRWAGFKDWQVQPSGVSLEVAYTVDKSKYLMDIITDVQQQLGYVFFIGEPASDEDLSIGTPIFRPAQSTLVHSQNSDGMIALHGKRMLTEFTPVHDNTNDRYIIRARGTMASRKKGGVPLYGDYSTRYTWQYWPPWMDWMAGVIKQLTYYDIGYETTQGLSSVQQCKVACLLIAMQVALARDTCTGTTLGHPGIGLDSFVYVTDEATGIASRVYITNRQTTMQLGGDGSSQVQGSDTAQDPLYSTDFGGALVDNPDWERLRQDYDDALHNRPVASWSNPIND